MSSLERLGERLGEHLGGGVGAAVEPSPPRTSWRGRRFDEDRLHLFVRDPRRVFAAWEVSGGLARRAAAMASGAGASLRYALAFERSEREGEPAKEAIRASLPDALRDEGWYADLPRGGGFCRALLGLELPDGFEPLLASRWMPVPPEGPCRESGEWPVDAVRLAWLAREAERVRVRAVPALPSSAARYLASPPVPRA